MTYRRLIAISFIFNGFLILSFKVVNEVGLSKFTPLVLFTAYGVSSVITGIAVVNSRIKIQRKSVLIGMLSGFSSIAGVTAYIAAAGVIPGYIVFPLVNGGTLLLVALVGRIFFHEKIGIYGIAGIIAGIVSLILLST